METLRRFFELKLHKSNGSEFQRLVETIMTYRHQAEFRQVKPNGRLGDGGNDGWIPNENIYMQIFAPDDLSKSAYVASKKLKMDFIKILESWSPSHPMKEYWFIVNDKYNGLSPQVQKAIQELESESNVKTKVIRAKLLEFYFQKLDLQTRKDIVEFPSSDIAKYQRLLNSLCWNLSTL